MIAQYNQATNADIKFWPAYGHQYRFNHEQGDAAAALAN